MKASSPESGLAIGSALSLAGLIAPVSDTPVLDCQLLLMHVLGKPRAFLFAYNNFSLTKQQSDQYRDLVARRASGEPVAYLLGYREFWNFQLKVDSSVLVPRPETELLVEIALDILPNRALSVVDLGTGSGAIAISLAVERPDWTVVATDIESATLAVAQENINQFAAARVRLCQGNWLAPFGPRAFDAVISNPPYISDQDPHLTALTFEPRRALESGRDGLDGIRIITAQAATRLRPGGLLLVEHGNTQAASVAALFAAHDFRDIHCHHDLEGRPRVTAGYIEVAS